MSSLIIGSVVADGKSGAYMRCDKRLLSGTVCVVKVVDLLKQFGIPTDLLMMGMG